MKDLLIPKGLSGEKVTPKLGVSLFFLMDSFFLGCFFFRNPKHRRCAMLGKGGWEGPPPEKTRPTQLGRLGWLGLSKEALGTGPQRRRVPGAADGEVQTSEKGRVAGSLRAPYTSP